MRVIGRCEIWPGNACEESKAKVARVYILCLCSILLLPVLYGPGHAKTCLMLYAINKGADQPAHPRSLISTFVVCCLDSMICILRISKVSRF